MRRTPARPAAEMHGTLNATACTAPMLVEGGRSDDRTHRPAGMAVLLVPDLALFAGVGRIPFPEEKPIEPAAAP